MVTQKTSQTNTKNTRRTGGRQDTRSTNRTDRQSQQAPNRGRRKSTNRTRNTKRRAPRGRQGTKINRKKEMPIPPLASGDIRIIPLGGVESIGKNMALVEYKDEIVVIDMGVQFPEEGTLGVDLVLPNTKYLEERKDKIKAIFITHGHLDHIGAIPYLMDRIGNPPMYVQEFGAIMIQKRQVEFPESPKIDMRTVEGDERLKIGNHFTVSFFSVNHSIPDAMGLVIKTDIGSVAFTGDIRVDHRDGVPTKEEEKNYEIFKKEKPLVLMMDSTNIENPGWSTPEHIVVETIEPIIKNAKGRLIIASFASQVERIIKFIEIAKKYGKKIVVEGRSMKTNMEIVKQLNLTETDHIIPIEAMEEYSPDKIMILATGSQGEEFAALMRISNKTHRHIRLKKDDTVLLSSSVIPGNEPAVSRLKDGLYRQGPSIITYREAKVHSSGHGNREELRWIHEQIDYRFFIPVHGHHYMLKMHAELAKSMGIADNHIVVPDDGSVIEVRDGGKTITTLKEKAPSNIVTVDGHSVSDTQDLVIRDRQLLAKDGIFIIVASVDPRTGSLKKSPDIISRGFVHLKESQDLLNQTRLIIKRSVEQSTKSMRTVDFETIKADVTMNVRKFLLQQTAKTPIVIPVILAV